MDLENIVVRIYDLQTDKFLGCGFFIDSNYIVTCSHVIGNREKMQIRLSDFSCIVDLVTCNEEYDISYLCPEEIPNQQFKPLNINYTNQNGIEVKTYGYSKQSPKRGVPASLKFTGNSKEDGGRKYLAFDKASSVTVGYSGSPVVNMDGELIGMIAEISYEDEYKRNGDQCFAIPVKFLEQSKPNFNNDELFSFCHRYIKHRVSSALFKLEHVEQINIRYINQWFNDNKNNHNYKNWLCFFQSFISIRKAVRGESGTKVNLPDSGILNWFKDTVEDSKFSNPISVRGTMKSGKSLFLSFCFLYLFYQYTQKQFKYIPIYINIEYYKKHHGATDEFVRNAKSAYHKFLQKADDMAKDYDIPICFLIDGLSEYNYYGTDEIEQYIMSSVRARRKNETDKKNKYIFVIDTEKDVQVERTCVSEEHNAEYLMYFDHVDRININSGKGDNSNTANFIKHYCSVFGLKETNAKTIIKNFSLLNLSYINIHFLTQFGKKLSDENFADNVSVIYQNYFHDIVSEKYHVEAERIAFKMYYTNDFKSFLAFKNKIDMETFEIIKNEKILADYLVASYYINNIKNFQEKKDVDFDVLNLLFNKDVAVFIVDIIRNKHLAHIFIAAEESLYKVLNNFGRASLSYLLGRIDIKQRALRDIFKNQQLILNNEKGDIPDTYRFVAERSLIISKISATNDKEHLQYSNEYIIELLQNSKKRAINRCFNRLYYGDIALEDFEEAYAMDIIGQGFDFYKTFHRLATRIEHDFIENGAIYPLLNVELFSLCNLVQVRMQVSSIVLKNKEIPSFFFYQKYSKNSLMVVEQMLKFLEKYLNTIKEEGNPVYQYFSMMLIMFQTYKKNFKNKNLQVFNPASIIKKIERLFLVERIGWKINDYTGIISQQAIESIPKTSPFETTAEHVFSTYLIGLFFLPKYIEDDEQFKDIDRSKYSKQEVLNLIMIHDLGESETGDYPPYYENIDSILYNESAFIRQLFLHGTYENLADIFECYELWDKWSKNYNNDDNIRIAKELDRVQMLYKYYSLLVENKLFFTERRRKNIHNIANNITTSIGKKILEVLVTKNPDFKGIID